MHQGRLDFCSVDPHPRGSSPLGPRGTLGRPRGPWGEPLPGQSPQLETELLEALLESVGRGSLQTLTSCLQTSSTLRCHRPVLP